MSLDSPGFWPSALRELRAVLTPDVRTHLEETMGGRNLLEIFVLLRRLQPGDVRTARLCHRVLVRAVKYHLAMYGFVDPEWANLTRMLAEIVEAEGFRFDRGRWKRWTREEIVADQAILEQVGGGAPGAARAHAPGAG